MCGRFVLSTTADALAEHFGVAGVPLLRPRYNIAPSQDILALRYDEDGEQTWAELRWGLVPSWAKDPAIGYRMINARSETAAEKPSFRTAMRRRRAVVPFDGFYEWKREGKTKQPWYFRSVEEEPLAVAALWEFWKSSDDEIIESVALLTTSANELMKPIHHRMPVLLDQAGRERWLEADTDDASELEDLFTPYPSEFLEAWRVATTVNNARNDDPSNVEPLQLHS